MAERIDTKKDDQGLLAVAANSAALIGEKAVTTSFGLVRDARGELNQRTLALIDWLDSVQQSGSRVLRSAVQRADDLTVTVLDSGERLGLAVVRTIHTTSNGAASLASRTASSLTSTRSNDVIASA
jgi:hypothetical protein